MKISQNEARRLKRRVEFVGLTKREEFAMAALTGILANSGPQPTNMGTEGRALCAVDHADALLLALNQEPRT